MRLKLLVVFSIIFFIFLINVDAVDGYGWGYKKNYDNKLPEVGKFGEILKEYDPFYADLTADKEIYFTFENGYEQGFTEEVLDVLKKHQVPATFFVTGHYVKTEPDLVMLMVDEGHIIGKHSYI